MLRADHQSRAVPPSVVCLSVTKETHRGGVGPLGLSGYKKLYYSLIFPKLQADMPCFGHIHSPYQNIHSRITD